MGPPADAQQANTRTCRTMCIAEKVNEKWTRLWKGLPKMWSTKHLGNKREEPMFGNWKRPGQVFPNVMSGNMVSTNVEDWMSLGKASTKMGATRRARPRHVRHTLLEIGI